jgi:hypothetical protein
MALVLTGNSGNVTAPLTATVTALANNGSGEIRVTTSAPHLFGDGDPVRLVTGVITEDFAIKVIDSVTFDCLASTFTSTSTGTATDLALTPQIQVPTDGQSSSLQLSGMLSAFRGILDRTQALMAWVVRLWQGINIGGSGYSEQTFGYQGVGEGGGIQSDPGTSGVIGVAGSAAGASGVVGFGQGSGHSGVSGQGYTGVVGQGTGGPGTIGTATSGNASGAFNIGNGTGAGTSSLGGAPSSGACGPGAHNVGGSTAGGGTGGDGAHDTGTGNGTGTVSQGGPSAGIGAVATGGTGGDGAHAAGGNGDTNGYVGSGVGTGAGVVGIGGASGPGGQFISASATVPAIVANTGPVQAPLGGLTGVLPNCMYGNGVVKARGRLHTDGAGNVVIEGGLNVAAAPGCVIYNAGTGCSEIALTLPTPMADTHYSVLTPATYAGAEVILPTTGLASTTNSFIIYVGVGSSNLQFYEFDLATTPNVIIQFAIFGDQ